MTTDPTGPVSIPPLPPGERDAHHDDPTANDGIRELDNDLPRWWLVMFLLTIAFAAWYPFYWHSNHRLGAERLLDEQTAAAEQRAESATGPVSEDTLRLFSHAPAHIAHGGELFAKNGCAVCHGADATGLVGPNLRDDYWIYGHDMTTIVDVITNGRANGTMPPQKANLAPEDIRDLACWIAERARSDKSAGKAPDPTREKLAPIDY